MPNVAVILPAAGQSSRFRLGQKKKVFTDLKGRPIWLRSAEHFANHGDVCQTIIVISPDDLEFFKEKYRPNLALMDFEIATGGATRAESVKNAMVMVIEKADYIAVHDAARPLLAKRWIDTVFSAAFESGAAIPARRIAGTVKRVDESNQIEETVDRSNLWEAQTPQVFRRDILEDGYARADNFAATDEAQLVQDAGHRVTVVEGWPMNFKITTGDDFKMAESVVNRLPKDEPNFLHPFANEEPRNI